MKAKQKMESHDAKQTFDHFRRNGTGQWTTLYHGHRNDTNDVGIYCALAPMSKRSGLLSDVSWDLRIGAGQPGFMQTYEHDRQITEYHRYGSDDDVEPLVFHRDFHGIKPSHLEIGEEFRYFHNLFDEGNGRFFKFDNDGAQHLAAEITSEHVRVLTRLIRQFQAARQLDLLLFIDAVFSDDSGEEELFKQELIDPLAHFSFFFDRTSQPVTLRIIGKQVFPAPNISEAGIWPYESKEHYFPEFIIGCDEKGRPVVHSCDPSTLGNYFGANSDHPHYLTPVFFQRGVLQKYYEDPEHYTVEDGCVHYAGLWTLRLDNNHSEYVVVYLGDIGRDLPERERDYWRSFNVLPDDNSHSVTAIRRGLLGEFADPTSPDLVFRKTYASFCRRWYEKFGWHLFRIPNAGDEHILQRVRVPLLDSEPEFESQLMNLARLLVDSLNDGELSSRSVARTSDGLGSIKKLETWLTEQGYPNVGELVQLLQNLQVLRSKGAAHRKGSDYTKTVVRLFGEMERREIIRTLLEQTNSSLGGLARHFLD